MPVFKCKRCGANLDISEGSTVVKCEFCDTEQTIPRLDTEKKLNLFNRANKLRSVCEFDNAESLFQNIVSEFSDDAESFWGLCLCRYGIEYVDDPLSGRKIPTCHRASYDSILKDADYQQALKLADSVNRRLYEEEAKEIDSLQQKILSVVKNEKPYDVFICYKESDEFGDRTPDSVLAQDIYDSLTGKGMKVFFSRITLENKLGVDYEPYIFAALQSAKVMLVVATKPEYAEAVWVKNEWGRFARLARKDRQKTIIPCYQDMDPADLPTLLSTRQAQDMSKLGALQDLTRGVMKLCGITDTAAAGRMSFGGGNQQTAALIKRAQINLESSLWDKADESAEKVLDIAPENSDAYLIKFMASRKINDEARLDHLSDKFWDDVNYKLAYKHGDESAKKRLDEHKNKSVYNKADAEMKTADGNPDNYIMAAEGFHSIADYSDAAKKEEECREKAKALHYTHADNILKTTGNPKELDKALNEFRLLGDYRDSADKAKETREKMLSIRYNTLVSRLSNVKSTADLPKLADIAREFEELGDYRDSKEKAKEARNRNREVNYNTACSRLENTNDSKNLAEVIKSFERLNNYKDSAQKLEEAKAKKKAVDMQLEYLKAQELTNSGKPGSIEDGILIYRQLQERGYRNLEAEIKKAEKSLNSVRFKDIERSILNHTKAESLYEDIKKLEKIDADAEVNRLLNNTKDYIAAVSLLEAAEMMPSSQYKEKKLKAKKYREAEQLFSKLAIGNFKNSKELQQKCKYSAPKIESGSSPLAKLLKTVFVIAVLVFCVYAFLNYMDPKDPGTREDSLFARCYRLACKVLGDEAENHSDYNSFISGNERDISEDLIDKKASLHDSTLMLMIPAVSISMFLILFIYRFLILKPSYSGDLEEGFYTWVGSSLGLAAAYRIGAALYVHIVHHEFIAFGSGLQFFVYAALIAGPVSLALNIIFAIICAIYRSVSRK